MKCRLLFSSVLMLLAAHAQAQAVLSWQECVQKVRQKNPDLFAAIKNVNVYQAEASGAYYNFFPQLSASAGYTTSSSQGLVPTPGSLTQVVTIQNQYTESLSLNQSIFNGFTDIGKVRQGHANLRAAKAQLDLEKSTLSAALKTAYAQLLFEQKSVDLTASILKRQQDNIRMITLNYKGGTENKGNLLYQQGSLEQAVYQHEHAIRQLRNAVKQLAALWGEPNLKSLQVTGDLEWHLPETEPNFEDIAAKHPNHVNFVEQRMSAEANIEIVDGAWYPNLNLTGSVGRVGGEWPPDSQRWSVGVTLTFPFFPGTSQIYAAQTARAERDQAVYEEHSTDYKLIAALESAYDALLDAVQQVEVAKVFQQGALARSRIANGKYSSGLMTFEDWSVIDTDLVNREQNLLQSQLNAMQAQATWEAAEGIGDI